MNGKCLDIGTIQAFLDGETRPEEAVSISDHVAECDACTLLLAQADEENSLVFSVLDREMNTLVPTQRLWNRINAEITVEKSHATVWQRIVGVISASLFSPGFAGAAAVLLFVAMLSVVWLNRHDSTVDSNIVAVNDAPQSASTPASHPEEAHIDITTDGDGIPSVAAPKPTVAQSNYSDEDIKKMITPTKFVERGPRKTAVIVASAPQFLPGEESYIKTISELEQSISPQNASVKASSQVAYQRDLAVVDDAIAKMRSVVRKNPRNQAARQILYSSYQDKIDLLKSSAQRDELMASLQ